MKELLRNFQNNSLLHGIERVTLLQKSLAAAIAYTAPCFQGSHGEVDQYYRNAVLTPAMQTISQVNELFVISPDAVLSDVELLWKSRYMLLNFPLANEGIASFHNSLKNGSVDLYDKYTYWVPNFISAIEAHQVV